MAKTMTASSQSNKVEDFNINNFRNSILSWYDENHRKLPWRAEPETFPDPYHEWLSEIMLQQTTVPTVIPYFLKFIEKWPTVNDLANAEKEEVMKEWAGLGYYARARNLHKCAQVVANDLGGVFPGNEKDLKSLPGIGDYTAAAVSAIAFNNPANVVDGNIERVMARLFNIHEPLPDSKKHLKELAGYLSEEQTNRPGDYAQGLMDLGATVCTPKSPKCLLCPVNSMCSAREEGVAAELPKKRRKKVKPHKFGYLYWVERDEQILLETRPETEMLGGMPGFITSEWSVSQNDMPKSAKTTEILVKHSFTHFDLTLEILRLRHEKGIVTPQNDHFWVSVSELGDIGFPTLFSKAVKLMK